jgi:hypothetical protein
MFVPRGVTKGPTDIPRAVAFCESTYLLKVHGLRKPELQSRAVWG